MKYKRHTVAQSNPKPRSRRMDLRVSDPNGREDPKFVKHLVVIYRSNRIGIIS